MRILLDQGTPVGIRRYLASHTCRTAREEGWSTLLNGELLRAAEAAGFNVLLTTDQNISHQQNLAGLKIAVVALNTTRWSHIEAAADKVVQAIEAATPGMFSLVKISPTSA